MLPRNNSHGRLFAPQMWVCDASFLNRHFHGLPLRRQILKDSHVPGATPEKKGVELWALGLIWASGKSKKMGQILCLPPARLFKAGMSQTLHSAHFGDNFIFIKADIMTLPPTQSTVIMKMMFHRTTCSAARKFIRSRAMHSITSQQADARWKKAPRPWWFASEYALK